MHNRTSSTHLLDLRQAAESVQPGPDQGLHVSRILRAHRHWELLHWIRTKSMAREVFQTCYSIGVSPARTP